VKKTNSSNDIKLLQWDRRLFILSKVAVVTKTRHWLLVLALLTSSACGSDIKRGADLNLEASPTTASFSTVNMGDTAVQAITLTHTGGSGTLRLSPATLQSKSGDFQVEGPIPLTLEPKESAVLTITYTPSDMNYDVGQILIGHNISKQPPLVIPITTLIQVPRLKTAPSIINFGDVSAGTENTMKVTVSNPGSAPLNIQKIGLDLDQGAPFGLENLPELPVQLSPNNSVELSVTFAPPLTGEDRKFESRLRFVTDHEETNNRYSLVIGHARNSMLTLQPGVLNFGWVAVGQKQAMDLQLKNNGTQALTFESIMLVDGHPDVSLLGAPTEPGMILQPFESLILTLIFQPSEIVSTTDGLLGKLKILSNDFVLPERDLPIHGRSAEPSLSIVPSEVVDFGIVGLGYQHKRTVKLVNMGQVPLTITDVLLAKDTPEAFYVAATPKLPVSLAPLGGVAEVTLAYLNSEYSDGDTWGEMIVVSTDPVSPESTRSLKAGNAEVANCIPRFEPPTVEFGAIGPGSKLQKSFKLFNDGSLPCQYKKVNFVDCANPTGICQSKFGQSDVFSLGDDSPVDGTMLMFGDVLEFPVWFEPATESGENAGLTVVTLINGAGDGPYMQYHSQAGGVLPSLHGLVGTAGIVTQPSDVNFGLTTLGCGAKPADILAKRIGPLPIKWTAINSLECDEQFNATNLPEFPELLGEIWDKATPFKLQYVPTKTGYMSCVYTLEPDIDEAGIAAITVTGFGTLENSRTEYFVQAPESYVDILFVVDNSGSMKGEQESLAKGFEGFVAQAQVWEVKYQIGVVTTDKGQDQGWLQGAPAYVTNLNPEPFKSSAIVGTKGSGTEQGLVTSWLALQPDMLSGNGQPCTSDFQCNQNSLHHKCVLGECGGPNRGFLRNNSTLAIIWISDENDQSNGPIAGYVNYFKQLKGEDMVKGYAIVGDPPTSENPNGGCLGDDFEGGGGPFGGGGKGTKAKNGDRYVNAAKMLGGFWYSICKFGKENIDQPPLLEQIGKDAFKPVNVFPLSEEPSPGTLVVTVNDDLCEQGWTYDTEKQAVIFDIESPCFPGPSAKLTILYEAICYPIEE